MKVDDLGEGGEVGRCNRRTIGFCNVDRSLPELRLQLFHATICLCGARKVQACGVFLQACIDILPEQQLSVGAGWGCEGFGAEIGDADGVGLVDHQGAALGIASGGKRQGKAQEQADEDKEPVPESDRLIFPVLIFLDARTSRGVSSSLEAERQEGRGEDTEWPRVIEQELHFNKLLSRQRSGRLPRDYFFGGDARGGRVGGCDGQR